MCRWGVRVIGKGVSALLGAHVRHGKHTKQIQTKYIYIYPSPATVSNSFVLPHVYKVISVAGSVEEDRPSALITPISQPAQKRERVDVP